MRRDAADTLPRLGAEAAAKGFFSGSPTEHHVLLGKMPLIWVFEGPHPGLQCENAESPSPSLNDLHVLLGPAFRHLAHRGCMVIALHRYLPVLLPAIPDPLTSLILRFRNTYALNRNRRAVMALLSRNFPQDPCEVCG